MVPFCFAADNERICVRGPMQVYALTFTEDGADRLDHSALRKWCHGLAGGRNQAHLQPVYTRPAPDPKPSAPN